MCDEVHFLDGESESFSGEDLVYSNFMAWKENACPRDSFPTPQKIAGTSNTTERVAAISRRAKNPGFTKQSSREFQGLWEEKWSSLLSPSPSRQGDSLLVIIFPLGGTL